MNSAADNAKAIRAIAIPLPTASGALVMVSESAAAEIRDAMLAAGELRPIEDAAGQKAADAILARLQSLSRALEESRKECTAPLLELQRKIKGHADDYQERMKPAIARARGIIGDYIARLQRERDEALRRQREAEQEAHRLQAEADEKARILKEEAETKHRQTQQAMAEDDFFDAEDAHALPAPAQAAIPALVLQAEVYVPPAPKSAAMSTRKTRELVCDDASACPVMVGEVEVRPVNEAAVRRLLLAGVSVPGYRLEEREVYAAKGGRW